MVLYKRNNTLKLILLRLLPVVLLFIIPVAYLHHFKVVGWVAVLLLVGCGFITITDVRVDQVSAEIIPGLHLNNEWLSVRRWFLFGLMPVTWRLSRDEVEQATIYKKGEASEMMYTDTLWDALLYFFPRRSPFQGIVLKVTTPGGDKLYVKVELSHTEYALLAGKFKSENAERV